MRGIQDLGLADEDDVVREAIDQVKADGRSLDEDRSQLQTAEAMRLARCEWIAIARFVAIDADHADARLDLLGGAGDARDEWAEATGSHEQVQPRLELQHLQSDRAAAGDEARTRRRVDQRQPMLLGVRASGGLGVRK